MFGQRTIKATTRAEVDAAFARADKIVVEGDDALLSYAATKAARDARTQGADVAIDTLVTMPGKPADMRLQRKRMPESPAKPVIAPRFLEGAPLCPPFPADWVEDPISALPPAAAPVASPGFSPEDVFPFSAFEPPPALPPPSPPSPMPPAGLGGTDIAPAGRKTRLYGGVGLAVLLLLASGVFVFFTLRSAPIENATFASQTPRLLDKQTIALLKSRGLSDRDIDQIRTGAAPDPSVEKTPATAPKPTPVPAAPGPSGAEPPAKQPSAAVLQALPAIIWSIVGLVAVLGLIFVARQAINNDRNVEVSWKVSEKISGRLVITKVAKARGRVPKAA